MIKIKLKKNKIKEDLGTISATQTKSAPGTSTEKDMDDQAKTLKLNQFANLPNTQTAADALKRDLSTMQGDQKVNSLGALLNLVGVDKNITQQTASRMK
jgi:hypothetical protein